MVKEKKSRIKKRKCTKKPWCFIFFIFICFLNTLFCTFPLIFSPLMCIIYFSVLLGFGLLLLCSVILHPVFTVFKSNIKSCKLQMFSRNKYKNYSVSFSLSNLSFFFCCLHFNPLIRLTYIIHLLPALSWYISCSWFLPREG